MIDLVLIAPVRAYREALAMAIDTDPNLELLAGVSSASDMAQSASCLKTAPACSGSLPVT